QSAVGRQQSAGSSQSADIHESSVGFVILSQRGTSSEGSRCFVRARSPSSPRSIDTCGGESDADTPPCPPLGKGGKGGYQLPGEVRRRLRWGAWLGCGGPLDWWSVHSWFDFVRSC